MVYLLYTPDPASTAFTSVEIQYVVTSPSSIGPVAFNKDNAIDSWYFVGSTTKIDVQTYT
jgi:hypothetical protein